MDLLLVLIAFCVVLLAVRLVRARRRGRPGPDSSWTPHDPPDPGPGGEPRPVDPAGPGPGGEPRPADARGAVSRHSWMRGDGGGGGG